MSGLGNALLFLAAFVACGIIFLTALYWALKLYVLFERRFNDLAAEAHDDTPDNFSDDLRLSSFFHKEDIPR